MSEIDRLRALHAQVFGSTMEPDPAQAGYMRRSTFCQFCASWRDEEDPRWPCETSRLLDVAEAAREPSSNEPDCTCDRDDDSDPGRPVVLCEKHERMLRPLRWDTLAMMVVDFLANDTALRATLDRLDGAS